ncbi:hypothetical protein Salat_0463200 [Sesamum alatum]|uniref:Proline-rich protein n=1 Tax=Sesamum alatum TaxID=300844 RepID=A0AAE1Z4H3_9LAMI|nr:hypothetical protein Salat_0463200 [Sesamum alatum]
MSRFSSLLLLLVLLFVATPCLTRSVEEDSILLNSNLSENGLTLDDEDGIWSLDASKPAPHRAKPPKYSKPPKHGKPPKHSEPPKHSKPPKHGHHAPPPPHHSLELEGL